MAGRQEPEVGASNAMGESGRKTNQLLLSPQDAAQQLLHWEAPSDPLQQVGHSLFVSPTTATWITVIAAAAGRRISLLI